MGVRLEDLPPHMRRKVEQQLHDQGVKRPRKDRTSHDGAPCPTMCADCPDLPPFPTYLKAQRHIDTEHGGVGMTRMVLP